MVALSLGALASSLLGGLQLGDDEGERFRNVLNTVVRAAFRNSAEGVKALRAAARRYGFTADVTEYPFGADHYTRTKELIPDSAFAEIAALDGVLLGAIGDPRFEPGFLEFGIVGRLRFDLDLFKKPTFTGASIVAFTLSASMFAMFLYLTLYIQNILGYSALEALHIQLTHYANHVGQMILLVKHLDAERWQTLTLPRRRPGTTP